jgi:hypothetical protein
MAEQDSNILSKLRKLFQSNIIIRKREDGKLVVKDVNYNQRGYASNFIDRYNRVLQSSFGSSYARSNNPSFDIQRIELFKDYELMDTDPILSSALDIYADESTVDNIEGEVLSIKTDNAEVYKILYNLFYNVLNIQFNLWSWVRNMVKYGDFFLQLDILDKHGIINVTPLSSYDVIRMEHHDPSHPQLVQFVLTGNTNTPSKDALEDYEVAHFRLLSDSNFAPYGKSMIEGARKIFKMLTLMEDAMLLHRIMRAPERRVFKIDIGNIPPNEVENFMNKVINKMKKTPVIDQSTGEYNLRYNIQSITEDFFLPVRGSDSGTSIETLPGLQYEATDDIEYIRNKMMASLRIPKAFLGYEEGVGSKATLAAEDVRFARTIERVQKIVCSELSKMAIVHLYTQGFEDAALLDFKLELQSPSTIHEQEKLELMSQKLDLASAAKDSRMFSNQWVYENIFDFNIEEMKSIIEQVTEDTKQKYRMDQIESEGNDPAQSGEPAGGEEGGIPEGDMARSGEWGGSKKDLGRNEEKHWGRDRLGKKDRNIYKSKSKEDSTKGKFKGKSPLAVSKGSTAVGYDSILDSLKLKYGKNSNDSGLLNENSLIDEDE